MNRVSNHDVLRLAMFKCVKDLDHYECNEILEVGMFKTNPIRGLYPVFIPSEDYITIALESDDRVWAKLTVPLKTGALFITDLTFEISPAAVEPEEIMEHLLIAVVRTIRTFRIKRGSMPTNAL